MDFSKLPQPIDPAEPRIVGGFSKATAREFLDTLHQIATDGGDLVVPGCRARLCYRGVGSVQYRLVPSSLRADRQADLHRAAGAVVRHKIREMKGKAPPYWVQLHLEFGVLTEFCRFAQNRGLPIPRIDPEFAEVVREPVAAFEFLHQNDKLAREWPSDKYVEAIALAQHYGLPTRLLDWTRDPFTAAYFAASSGFKRLRDKGKGVAPDPNDKLSVWVMVETFGRSIGPLTGPLEIPMPPYHGNPNLAAQGGVFTHFRYNDKTRLADATPLLRAVQTHLDTTPHQEFDGKAFVRLDLPVSQAPHVLGLLMNRGYDAARLFPGFGGAAKAAEENGWVDESIDAASVT